jgi:hypothetical protein
MKKIILSLILCILPIIANAYVNRDNAVLRIMNKDAGKVQEVKIPVGQELQFEKMYINVRSCKQTDPFQAEDFFAFLEISERDKGQFFGGWMSRNEPGQNPLQHPDYDVWLVKCE